MSVETDPVPPVPSTTPVLNDNTGNQEGNKKLFENNWVQWLLNLRTKINVLNSLLVSISKLTGTGFIAISGGLAAVRTFLGPDSVKITNPDGSGGDPIWQLENDDSSLTPLTNYGKNMAGVRGWYRPALFESTGVLDGGTLSINAGDPTKYDVAASTIGYTDYSTNPAAPTRVVSLVGPFIAEDVPSLAVVATYVGIQMPAGTIIEQSSPFTRAQTRSIAPLGAVISNGVQLIAVNNLPGVMRAGINQVQDLMSAIGPMNLSGNVISANGVNLNIDKSAGVIFKQGSNFSIDEDDPHGLALAALVPASFAYRLSDGTQFATTNLIDPNNYESPLGTLTAVPAANRFTIQRITIFTSNLVRIQYGQFVYNTMGEAEASLATESFVTETNIAENGLLLCFLIVQDGATDLSDALQAKFIPASKFGGPVGSGGTSITNTDGLPEGLVNLYFTDARAQAAVVAATISSGDTTHAPSGDAVFNALALKANDSDVMHLSGGIAETATGIKTFSDRLVVGSSNHSLGFTPSLLVEFQDTTAIPSGTFVRYGNNANSPFNLGFKARGTAAAPSQTLAGDGLFAMRGGGWHNGGAFGNTQAGEITILAAEDFTSTAQGTIIRFRVAVTGATSATTRLTIDSNGDVFLTGGRLYGTAIHNNAAALTGTTNQYIGSGTYTPTGTGLTNVSSITPGVAQWMRVGNVVTVSGSVSVTPTAAAPTKTTFNLTLPLASNFAASSQCGGGGGRNLAAQVEAALVLADTVNDQATIAFMATSTGAATLYYSYQYLVL